MRNPPALALQRKMMLLSWQERSRWPQEQKGELFVNPSLPPHLIAGASPVMLFVPQNGRVCPSSEAAPVTLFQGRGQQGSPAGTAPSCPGHLPVPSLLDCWEAREAPETFPSVSYLVAEPRTAFWVETWNPLYAILPLHWSCPSLISRLPFSLRKQLLFKPVFLAQFCGCCCWFFFFCFCGYVFFFLWGLHVSGLCNTALWCSTWISEKISQHQWCHIIPCFGCGSDFLLSASDCNYAMQWESWMSEIITMFFMSEHI